MPNETMNPHCERQPGFEAIATVPSSAADVSAPTAMESC